MSSGFGRQFGLLARRSIARTLRDPGTIAPALLIPLLLYFVIAAGLTKATSLPGFPTKSMPTFALTLAFVNGALSMVGSTGASIAADIETNFLDRLVLTPMRGAALLLAGLAGTIVLGLIQLGLFFGVGFAYGAHIEAGWKGGLVIAAMFLLADIGFGALGLFLGLRTGSGQAVQGVAPMMLVFLFLSSVIFPRNLISADWFYWIATVNPVSYLVEGIRSVFIFGWDKQALLYGFIFVVALVVLSLLGASAALRSRLARA